jgi:hypothetical protein
MRVLKRLMGFTLTGAFFVVVSSAQSNDASDFGTSGLIRMPSARMAEDSTLRATIAVEEVANLYNITFQALPKVQATFRYAIFNPNNLQGSSDNLRDRSYEIKAEVLAERYLIPQIAIGARDVLGTGAWEGEYLVASKKWKSFDVSLGMGWGRLGTRSGFSNPLSAVSDKFDSRPGSSGGSFGGESRGNSFFRGDASIFGGIAYRFSSLPLTFLAEYESDRYDREVGQGTLENPSPVNIGLGWQPLPNMFFRVSWLRGDTLGITLSSQVETKRNAPRRYEKRTPPTNVDSNTGLPEGYNPDSWYDRMVFESEQSGLYLKQASLREGERKATMVIENRAYNLTADALNQIMSLSELYTPRHVSSVDFILQENGFIGPTLNYSLQRDDSSKTDLDDAFDQIKILAPRRIEKPTNRTDFGYPSLGFGLDLAAKVQLMDPEDPARKQIFAKLTGRLQLSDHVNLWGRYEQNLYNDFSTARGSDSVLPKVKTLVNQYLVNGASGIEQLYIEDKRSLSSSIHTWIYGGILETMYGGVGGEVLYSPYMQRWALGLNANAVKQRGFERNFEFRDYETVTAFASAYYASPFFDVDMAVHVGRYLAQDVGYTFEARRTFDSGFSIGGFFTRTNVSAEEFGEGSFDKGLFFRIPFNGLLPGNTRAAYSTILRPLERDGGRRLENFGGSLWFDRRSLRYDALDRHLNRMMPR